jgi:DNA-binding transcriptional LysR family regulator
MALDWDKLRIFHTVAEAGSFTHAGETLSLSQSAVSRQISSLEDSLGIILFHRHARGLVMTEQGELLFNTTRDIFGKLALIEGQLVDTRDKAEGPLTITAAEFIGVHWLAKRLAAFHEQAPDIQITMLLDDRVLNLGTREADVALRLFQPNQPDLIQKHLGSIPFGIFASQSYIDRHGPPRKAADLKQHTLITFPDNTPSPYANPNWLLRTAEMGHAHGGRVMTTNTVSAMAALVAGGFGIGTLPRFMVAGNPDIVPLLTDIKHPGVDMYFVYPEVRRHSRRIDMFRDFLLQNIGDGLI